MTSAQLTAIIGAILAGLGGLGGVIKWGIGRITHSIDESGKRIDKNTDAMIANTASNAVLSTKIDSIANFVHRATPGEGVPSKKKKTQTQPHGLSIVDPSKDDE